MLKSGRGWFLVSVFLTSFIIGVVLSQFGCGVAAEEWPSVPNAASPSVTVAVPTVRPLEVRPPRHDVSNAARIILGREYACLSTYEIFNPSDEAGYVSKLVISAQPAIAFETVAVEWTDDESKLPRAAMPEMGGRVRVSYPDVGVRVLPRSSRYLRICGVMKRVVGAGEGKGIEPESGTVVTAALVIAETLEGGHARFTDEDERPRHVLRASLPRVTLTPPSSGGSASDLKPGPVALFEWTVEAHWFGPVALKQFGFDLDVVGMEVCDFRLTDDSDEGPPAHNIVELTDARSSSRALGTACLDHPAELAVVFRDEYLLDEGSGPHFTLRARVKKAGEKPSFAMRFLRSNDAITDTLRCNDAGFSLFSSDHTMVPGIIWSDLSASSHAFGCGTSRDWTTDALLPL